MLDPYTTILGAQFLRDIIKDINNWRRRRQHGNGSAASFVEDTEVESTDADAEAYIEELRTLIAESLDKALTPQLNAITLVEKEISKRMEESEAREQKIKDAIVMLQGQYAELNRRTHDMVLTSIGSAILSLGAFGFILFKFWLAP